MNISEVQLVVFVWEEEENIIQVCEYSSGFPITRYQFSIDVVLREAKTGKIVANTNLRGSMPRECGQTEPLRLTRLEGSHISFNQVEDWLEPYVEEP